MEGKGGTFGCEIETKTGWHGPIFEIGRWRIPFRKKKFTKDRVTFFLMNYGRTHAAIFRRKALSNSPAVKVENTLVPKGD